MSIDIGFLSQANPATAVAQLQQGLMLLLPRGWNRVTLTVEKAGKGVRLAHIDAQAAIPGSMPPALLSADDIGVIINYALSELAEATTWHGPKLQVQRAQDGATLVHLEGHGHSQFVLTADAALDLLWTDQLFAAIDSAYLDISSTQTAFEETIQGFRRWDYNQDVAELSFILADGRAWSKSAQIIGSWASNQTWIWAWANSHLKERCQAAMAGLRNKAPEFPGLSALSQKKIICLRSGTSYLGVMAAAMLQTQGVFLAPNNGGVIVIAVS